MRKQWTPTYKEQMFKRLGYRMFSFQDILTMYNYFRRDPFYIGKQVLFNVFTSFALRKDFELKEELDWVMGQLHAGGFWDKWNSDQFIREIFLPEYVDKSPKKLQIHHYYFPFALHGLGLSGAMIILFVEKIWRRTSRASKTNDKMIIIK